MRNYLRSSGALAILIAVTLFLYGSIKLSNYQEDGSNQMVIGQTDDGEIITAQAETRESRYANIAFNSSGIFLVMGGILLLLSYKQVSSH